MSLYSYLVRLETILYSRQDLTIEQLQIDVATVSTLFRCELQFRDGSRLSVTEHLEPVGQRDFRRTTYRLNYLDRDGTLVFRYDNAPHYPRLSTFPAHKHAGGSVVEAEPPELSDVLAEIDAIVYGDSESNKPG
jgi:hypothetical protein